MCDYARCQKLFMEKCDLGLLFSIFKAIHQEVTEYFDFPD